MVESLPEFFKRLTGKEMLPYQERFGAEPLAATFMVVPTGLGKTLTVLIPWLYLVNQDFPGTPTRLVVVLPRQNLTEQTFRLAKDLIAEAGLTERVLAVELMGGSSQNSQTLGPDQRAIIIATQDMYLSRALNRGYARRPTRWPIDFALLNQDCLVVFDEIQLMSDGLASSTQLAAFRQILGTFGDTPCIWMSATAKPEWLDTVDFASMRPALRLIQLDERDLAEELVRKRLDAPKTLHQAPEECRTPAGCARFALSRHLPGTRTLIIANTVQRAREIFVQLEGTAGSVLLHSRFRPADRAVQIAALGSLPPEGQIIVATQVLEAGIDLSADRLITDVAPWGSLVQRFGRVNRYGDLPTSDIWWVDEPLRGKLKPEETVKLFAPYAPEEIGASTKKLKSLTSAAPRALPAEDGPAPWRHVLRRADLMDLFDTSSDLHGNQIDISRFIRSAEERDCFVAWRNLPGGRPSQGESEVADAELCAVPIDEMRSFLKRNDLFFWNFVEGQWQGAEPDRLFPGIILLADTSSGGYTNRHGWAPESKRAVDPIPNPTSQPDADGSDEASKPKGYRQTLVGHTNRVVEETERLLDTLSHQGVNGFAEMLRLAALRHDWGKAHWVMQMTLHKAEHWEDLLAKQLASRSGRAHSRRHFRHELASALAMLSVGDSDLAAYIVAAHHGKVRMAIRSFEGENGPDRTYRVRGIEDGDELPPCQLSTDSEMGLVRLSLDLLALGLHETAGASWSERVLRLRDTHGPFRLAYLETILRIADERASAQPGTEVEYE
ncbi:MAG: CRISPR-associated helicase Cas3' [Bryobacteraceae bacterium]